MVAAVMAGLFLAPKEARPIPHATTVVVRLDLLCGGAGAAWFAGFRWLGLGAAVLALARTVLAGDTKSVAEACR